MRYVAVALVGCFPYIGACGAEPADVERAPSAWLEGDVLSLAIDIAPSADRSESYLCFAFDTALLEGRAIRGIDWSLPEPGAGTLHHATLVATAQDAPDGPVECEDMPEDAIGMHVWSPGGTPLDLGDEIGFALPSSVSRMVVEAHVFHAGAREVGTATARLRLHAADPSRSAGWLGVGAPVPAIRPHHEEISTGACAPPATLHLVSTWPHMHRTGREFHGSVVRGDGSRVPLVDVMEWDFDAQRTYSIGVVVEPGDRIETTCVWQNPSDEYVLPGRFSSDEMCNQGLIGWPAEAAACAR